MPVNIPLRRTPLKDESGKYQIHPMFVKQDVVDREKMEKRVRDHCAMWRNQHNRNQHEFPALHHDGET